MTAAPGAPGLVQGAGTDENSPSLRRDPIAGALLLLGAFIACCTAWWASGLGNATLSSRFTGAATVPAGVILVLVALRLRHTRRLDPRTRRAWSILAVAVVGYSVGVALDFGSGPVPFLRGLLPVSLGLEVATYPLVVVALAMLPKPARTTYELVLLGLDTAIVAWGATMLIWHFLIFPVARDTGQGMVAALGASLFPVADLTIVFVIAAIVIRDMQESSRAALSVAGLAFLSIFFGQMVASVETLKGAYQLGGLSGFFYSIAWFGLALAAYLQWLIKDRDRPILNLAGYVRSYPWLPYVAIALAFVAPAIRDWNDPDMLRQHVPATGLLIALVVARLGVTARQNASLATAERERLAAAVDQAAEAMLTTDRFGNITYVNPAFTRITGYSATEVLGRNPEFLADPANPARLGEMREALARGESWEGRLIQRRRNGATVELAMAIAPLRDAAGAIVGSVEVARDISHERALEAQLAQGQRMEAIGRLAGGVAHDFNNILTAIRGFSELAEAQLGADHPVAADIQQIRDASDRAAALTRSLLTFGRRQVMQSRVIDVNQVLAGLTPMLGRLIGEDVRLIVRVDPRLGLTTADSAQIEQVILNLAVNARDAMPDGGTLTIATANADLDAGYVRTHLGASEGQYVVLTVADTGIGMTPEVMEHAFEPFFTTKERGKGTGLGLATAFGIAQQFGGFVGVESEPDAGSVFSFYLPRRAGATQPAEAADLPNRPRGGREAILVAEDEDAVRRFVERVLVGAGYRVTVASNGTEAIALAKSLPHLDLLFTDVVMPGISGVQLAAHLSATRPEMPIIYASGYSEEGIPRGTGAGGRTSYLPKPFTAERLLLRIREVLDQHAAAGTRGPSEAAGAE